MKKLILLMSLMVVLQITSRGKIRPIQLTCEYLDNPTVVDVRQPRLGWINIADADERGQEQTAWQIRVASSGKLLETPDLWDSGKKKGDQSIRISYEGKPLKS